MFSTPLSEAITEAESLVAAAPFIESEADLLEGLQYLAGCISACTSVAFDYDRDHPLAGAGIALLVVSIVVAAGFSIVRATTVRVWLHDGRLLRQGTAMTIVLWLVAIAIHLGGDHLIAPHDADRIGSVSLLLYLGVSLAVQRFALGERARRLLTAGAWPDDTAT